jgi:hypothetical protein
MIHKKRFFIATVFVLLLSAFVTSSAFAHICTPANKLPGAGSLGVYNVVTETFEPGKKLSPNMANGGFVTITDGATFAYDIFLHQTLPIGALTSGPGGDDQCDGLGVDNFLACLGFPLE